MNAVVMALQFLGCSALVILVFVGIALMLLACVWLIVAISKARDRRANRLNRETEFARAHNQVEAIREERAKRLKEIYEQARRDTRCQCKCHSREQ